MPLSCDCDYDGSDADSYCWTPDDYTCAPESGRRKRCKSCHNLIDHGSTVLKFTRTRYANNDIEERIYGYEDSVTMASWWLCERCADLFWSLSELGFCVSPEENMRELVKEYAEMVADENTKRGAQVWAKQQNINHR